MTAPGRPCILVVDDEPGIAELLTELLSALGYEVVTAEHGRRALDRLAERPVDLMISDVMMPVLDGPGLYREATRQFPYLRERFIWITGEVPGTEMREFLYATGAPLLPKPFTLESVRHAIRRGLESR
jgi:CheY-like chemotaxis protein